MSFKKLSGGLIAHFDKLSKDNKAFFETDIDKDVLWNLYLDSFPAGTNELFRKRREYDCSCCRSFIRNIGGTVFLKDNQVYSIWDFETGSPIFQPVVNALSTYVKSKPIKDVYFSSSKRIGVEKNVDNVPGSTTIYDHFYLDLPSHLINHGHSEGAFKGSANDLRNVFKTSLDIITEASILTVSELIAQNSLYKGDEWTSVLQKFIGYKKVYDNLDAATKELYTWEKTLEVGPIVGKLKNHSIGTLLVNISEDMDLDVAVSKYEAIVSPENYKRPKAIFTQRMLDDAKKTLEDLGYLNSLGRRYATLEDITVNNILFSNKDSAKRLAGTDVFSDLSKEIKINPKQFSKTEEISIDDFISNVLPSVTNLEVLLENRLGTNMVSLIAPQDKSSKSMFKWGNSFSWAYSGNITDSSLKQNVKSAGGAVDGVLRFSIQWNDLDRDENDLDAHCKEPGNFEIYFVNKNRFSPTGGRLDVDITCPNRDVPAVENITWASKDRMKDGVYEFFVHQWCFRGGRKGFRAEIEFDGQIYSYNYEKVLNSREKVPVANVILKNGVFSIKEHLSSSTSSRSIWNLSSNQFVPVSVFMLSPNYWDEQNGIGHKHYFFMLKDCVNSELPNGFYNEFLKEELLQQKRVLEALGGRMHVSSVADQLSGVGFSSSKRNELILKVSGNIERVMKVKF